MSKTVLTTVRMQIAKLRSWQQGLLALLYVLSVLLRVGVAFYRGDHVPPPPGAPDDTSYSYLAERLATGYGYSFDQPWYPFGKPAGYPTAHWSFLYTIFLAGVYALVGIHPLAGRLVGALLGGLLLPLMVYRLSRRLFPGQDRVALFAVGCTAFYAQFILFAAKLMTENFYLVALLWTMERALALAEQPNLTQGIVLGFALGVAVLLRQSALPWIVLLFAWLLWVGWRTGRLKHTIGALMVAGILLILAILPFTIRNYCVYGDFLLLNSNTGYAMYSAQHPMHGTSFQEYDAVHVPAELRSLSEAQLDRELMRLGIGFVLTDPWRYFLLSLSRIPDYFEFWPTPDTILLHNVGRMVSFGLFLPFMLCGLWMAVRRFGPLRTPAAWTRFSVTPVALILLFMVSYSLLHILTWAMPRYRLPVDAVAMPFAALALAEVFFPAVVGCIRRFGITTRRV